MVEEMNKTCFNWRYLQDKREDHDINKELWQIGNVTHLTPIGLEKNTMEAPKRKKDYFWQVSWSGWKQFWEGTICTVFKDEFDFKK